MREISCDILIIGGGIAGLWLLEVLRRRGYSVLLLESDAIGAKQSGKAQGIIHGGLKYALSGVLNSASDTLADLPAYWKKCLAGCGAVDLSNVEILASKQYMWSTNKLAGSLATLFASNAMRSHVAPVDKSDWPSIIRSSAISSNLYEIDETIVNVVSLLTELFNKNSTSCIKIDNEDYCALEHNASDEIKYITTKIRGQDVRIFAQAYVLTAGINNQKLQGLVPVVEMQSRPLHMVWVKGINLPVFYGHCIGLGTVPRLTITSHHTTDGNIIWYLGGKLAEDGVKQSSHSLIEQAKIELRDIFPQFDFSGMNFGTFVIERAEAKQSDGSKPNDASMFTRKNQIIAWPTKMVLAPRLAAKILDYLTANNFVPDKHDETVYQTLPRPSIKQSIWDESI